jgi:hypothetical protein
MMQRQLCDWCDCHCAVTGSADAAVIPSGIGGFIACKALSKRNDDPATASRPWDRERDGFVMGEGAGGGGHVALNEFSAGCAACLSCSCSTHAVVVLTQL